MVDCRYHKGAGGHDHERFEFPMHEMVETEAVKRRAVPCQLVLSAAVPCHVCFSALRGRPVPDRKQGAVPERAECAEDKVEGDIGGM